MTLVQLKYLVALDQIRHFRRAAAFLGVSQPNLSNQLSNLEKSLDVQLFDRNQKPIVPTQIGEQVIAQARVILGEAERVRHIVQGMTGEMAERLRIGIVPTLSDYIVPIVLSGFSTLYPEVSVEILEMRGKEVVEQLNRDTIDVGLVTSFFPTRGIIEEPLFEEPLVCYVSRTHPLFKLAEIKPQDLNINDIWLMKEDHALREQVIALCSTDSGAKSERRVLHFESDSLESLKRLVETGHNLTVLPASAVTAPSPYRPELVRPFKEPVPRREVRLIYSRTLIHTQVASALAAEIRKLTTSFLPAAA